MENNKDMSISFTKWEEDGEVGYEATLGADNSSGITVIGSTKEEVLASVKRTFSSSRFLAKLNATRVNWLGVSPKVVTSTVLKFIASL